MEDISRLKPGAAPTASSSQLYSTPPPAVSSKDGQGRCKTSAKCSCRHQHHHLSSRVMTPTSPSRIALVANRRKPLNSPSHSKQQLMVPFNPRNFEKRNHDKGDDDYSSKSTTNESYTREVFNLNEQQVILTRKSTVDVSLVDPKRPRLDDTYTKIDFRNVSRSSSSSRRSVNRYLPSKENNFSRRCKPENIIPLPMNSKSDMSKAISSKESKDVESKPLKIPPFSITKIYSNPTVLVPEKCLWGQFMGIERDNVNLLGGIASVSDKLLKPTTLIETNDMVFIKYEAVPKCEEARLRKSSNKQSFSIMNILSNVVKWMFRIE